MARIHKRAVQKCLDYLENHNGVVIGLEWDILECDIKCSLGNITMNKACGGGGIPAELFQILKDDAVKKLYWIDSKFGELSCGHRTEKGQFSFQLQRRAMPNNVPITIQLHSFHMLARQWSKSFKLNFNSTWTENFQMYNLDLEKAEEPEIKLLTSIGSKKKQENFRMHILLLHWLC